MAAEVNPSMNRIEIGENIRKRREALGLSQQELGLRLGTNANAVYLYESAQREIGSDRLCQIADALQTSPSSLLPQRYVVQTDIQASQVNRALEGLTTENQNAVMQMLQTYVLGLKLQQQMAG